MWTQYTLPLGLYVFRIKFGLCSHYFFLVSIETTIDLLETENMMLIGNKKNNWNTIRASSKFMSFIN